MPQDSDEQPDRRRADVDDTRWGQVWQLPLLVLGVVLFGVGIFVAMPREEPYDFVGELDKVAAYFQAGNHEAAHTQLDAVQERIAEADAAVLPRYWQYWGDLNYLQVHAQPPSPVEDEAVRRAHEQTAGYYAKAQELAKEQGQALPVESIRRHAQTLVALGRQAEAMAMLGLLKDAAARDRYRVVRQLIEYHRRTGPRGDVATLMPLIERFQHELRQEPNAALRREQEIWSARLQARLRLEANDAWGAIEFLLQRLPRLGGVQGGDVTPLVVLLAQAYHQAGELRDAQRYYDFAQQHLDASDGLNAEVLVGLGQIALTNPGEQGVQQALELFSRATQEYPSEPAYVEALIGRADCEARLQDYPRAVEHFGRAVEWLATSSRASDPRRGALSAAVRSHIQWSAAQDRHDLALDLLTLLVPLYQPNLPPAVLLEFAQTHEKIASQRQTAAAGETLARDARRLANQEAFTHYAQAADYYLRHARTVTISDDVAHGQSLWQAATCFDRAQLWKEAIDVYSEFVSTRQTDSRLLDAVLHLGNALLADGQYGAARERFVQLISDHPHSPQAYQSLVPLARAHMALDETDRAERTLLSVVTDHEAITPESPEFRAALIELGKLYYRLGEQNGTYYASAIERLNEAVQRYGRSDEGSMLRFLLADAYRRSIPLIDRQLTELQGQAEREALRARRDQWLAQAQIYYNQVVNALEARNSGGSSGGEAQALSPLEQLALRNSYFYQADCAYERRQFELAIDLYDTAARRWKDDPASLVAMVQIVNAHCELGEFQAARVANERARSQLDRIPEEAFDDPTLPMTRQHWEDWLRWSSQVELFGSHGNAQG